MAYHKGKLAHLVDVSNNTVTDIKAGKQGNLTIRNSKKIAKALGISVDNFLI
ncbi:MAG: helix-turn-helix transcriptional regulator [Patescibacteria group bacterium]|nr:helix-turn-helix transcriptional regulator [Patescibacteria group bacterium]